MTDILTVESVGEWLQWSKTKAESLPNNISVGQWRHDYLKKLAGDSPSQAAFLQIAPYLNSHQMSDILDKINTEGLPKTTVSDVMQQEMRTKQDQKILTALNYELPAILEKSGDTLWHFNLAKTYMNRLMVKQPEKFGDIKNALPETMRALYGNWRVFENNGPLKVAFFRNQIQKAGVDQKEWDESELYFFNMINRKYKGKINLIPRMDVLKKMKIQMQEPFEPGLEEDAPADGTFTDDKGIKWMPLNRENDPYIETTFGMDKHKKTWNWIHKQILKNEGNIFISRINDPEDPNNIIMVLAAGDREYPEDIEIIADITTVDEHGDVGKAFMTQEDSIKLMQSRQAWEWANSQDDVFGDNALGLFGDMFQGEGWDAWDPITWIMRKIGLGQSDPTFRGIGGMEKGGDFGREEFMQLEARLGKKAWLAEGVARGLPEGQGPQYKGYGGLRIHAFGGKWFTDVAPPGQVEMDLFITPVVEEINNFEKALADQGNPREVTNAELWDIVQLVKSRLNGKPGAFGYGIFGEKKHRTLFDAYFNPEPPPNYEPSELERIIKEYTDTGKTSPEWDSWEWWKTILKLQTLRTISPR